MFLYFKLRKVRKNRVQLLKDIIVSYKEYVSSFNILDACCLCPYIFHEICKYLGYKYYSRSKTVKILKFVYPELYAFKPHDKNIGEVWFEHDNERRLEVLNLLLTNITSHYKVREAFVITLDDSVLYHNSNHPISVKIGEPVIVIQEKDNDCYGSGKALLVVHKNWTCWIDSSLVSN